jgi:hypothetical protein
MASPEPALCSLSALTTVSSIVVNSSLHRGTFCTRSHLSGNILLDAPALTGGGQSLTHGQLSRNASCPSTSDFVLPRFF